MTAPIPFEQYDRIVTNLENLRAEFDGYKALVEARGLIIDTSKRMIEDRDRVIARLLDGWRPVVDPPDEPGLWVETWYYTEEPTEEEMSDGEAAIIRAHQEKN